MSTTAVIERQRARAIVEGVNSARLKAREGFRLLAKRKPTSGPSLALAMTVGMQTISGKIASVTAT